MSFETATDMFRVPVSIRERVWGGEGLLAGLTAPTTADPGPAILAAVVRLRANEEAPSDDLERTRRIVPERLKKASAG